MEPNKSKPTHPLRHTSLCLGAGGRLGAMSVWSFCERNHDSEGRGHELLGLLRNLRTLTGATQGPLERWGRDVRPTRPGEDVPVGVNMRKGSLWVVGN